jgi:uncharacterized membrane protein
MASGQVRESLTAPERGIVATRLGSLDAMRGLIIVLMAIDHARAFVAKNHPGEFWGRPLPDYAGDAIAFLTRLVTHLCAPGFFFLMGTGMALLAASRAQLGWSNGRTVRHLALRGLALILLGQVLENGSFTFGFANATRVVSYGIRVPGADGTFPSLLFGVLYGLGAALILGGPLLWLRPAALVGAAVVCELAVQWVTPSASEADVRFHPLLRLFVIPGQTGPLLVAYPALAWLPCALLGAAFGQWLLDDRNVAFRRLGLAGLLFLGLFVVLRAGGGFGNIMPPGPGWIGFFNMVKYPPSLTFLLFTLGLDFLLLTAIERWRLGELSWSRPLQVFGAVPFFFFVAHLWLYAAIGRFFPAGTTIPRMYLFWLLGLVVLYFPCRWYGDFKRRRPPSSFFRML